jgi:hypothetical protein
MVELLSAATLPLAGHIVACPRCGYAHALQPLGRGDSRLVMSCGDHTLVMGEGSVLYREPQRLSTAG